MLYNNHYIYLIVVVVEAVETGENLANPRHVPFFSHRSTGKTRVGKIEKIGKVLSPYFEKWTTLKNGEWKVKNMLKNLSAGEWVISRKPVERFKTGGEISVSYREIPVESIHPPIPVLVFHITWN